MRLNDSHGVRSGQAIPACRFVHALVLTPDPAWRRRCAEERSRDCRELAAVCGGPGPVRTSVYTCVGLQPAADLLLWSLGPSPDALEERAAAVLRGGLGAWRRVGGSLLGAVTPSPYAPRRQPAEPALFAGERARY